MPQPQSPSSTVFSPWHHVPTLNALATALLLRPLAYTLIDPTPLTGTLDGGQGRRPWWLFHGWILLFQWLPFAAAWWALRTGGRKWTEYGIDWSWFQRHKGWLLIIALSLAAAAVLAPRYLYGSKIPPVSQTFPLLPVTAMERLFFLVSSISAGICEETCYRGLPLRGIAGSAGGALVMLPATVVAFVFVHGWYGLENAGLYSCVGLLFGGLFIVLRRRHLEWLMVIHALIDGILILRP